MTICEMYKNLCNGLGPLCQECIDFVKELDRPEDECPICLKENCEPDCEAYEDGYI